MSETTTAKAPCPVCGETKRHECQIPLPPVFTDVKIGGKKP